MANRFQELIEVIDMLHNDFRHRYIKTIEFIALYDEPLVNRIEFVEDMLSVQTASIAFDVPPSKIADEVLQLRVNEGMINREDIR